MAFLLALALVVSVMSGLGLSVSAEQESNTPGTEEVQQQDKTEAGAAPSEGKAEEEAAKPEKKPVQEETKDEQKKQEETKTDDAAKDDANAQDGDQKNEPQAEPAEEEQDAPVEQASVPIVQAAAGEVSQYTITCGDQRLTVKLVDDSGKEVNGTAPSTTTLDAGNWKTINPDFIATVAGYTYSEAQCEYYDWGLRRTTITQIYYDDYSYNSGWWGYVSRKDSVSIANNTIYLVYTKSTFTIHYVDEKGTEIKTSTERERTPSVTFSDYVDSISGYTYWRACYSSANNAEVTKATRSGNSGNKYTFYNGDKPLEKGTENIDRLNDIYLVYVENGGGPGTGGGTTGGGGELQAPSHEKTAGKNTDSTYDLSLSVSGSVGNSTQKAMVDIIYVLDTSGSMTQSEMQVNNKWVTLLAAAKNAINVMSSGLTAPDSLIDARFALVTFAENSSITSFSNGNWTDSSAILYSKLPNTAGGGTNYEAGLKNAKTLLNTTRQNATTVVIFLSDGIPTFYVDGGTGSDDKDGRAMSKARGIVKQMTPNYLFTVGVGEKKNYENLYLVTDAVHSGVQAKNYVGDNDENLGKAFDDMKGKITSIACEDVTISDKLSANVAMVLENDKPKKPVGKVTDKNGKKVGTYNNDGSIDLIATELNGETKLLAPTYDSDTRTFEWKFPKGYKLEANYTYTVTANVDVTETAFENYRKGKGDSNPNEYPDKADAGTGTHANAEGLFSNDNENTKLIYTVTGESTPKEVKYQKPVVQLTPSKLTIKKTVTGLDETALEKLKSGLKFKVTYKYKNNVTKNVEVGFDKFTQQGDTNTYTYTSDDLKCWSMDAAYTVEEDGFVVEGYDHTGGNTTVGGQIESKNQDVIATFTNAYTPSNRTITLKKVVKGNMGDTNKEFKFSVSGGNATITKDTLKDDEETTITAKVGEKVTISEVDYTSAGYTTTASATNDVKDGKYEDHSYTFTVTKDMSESTIITFVNDKTINPPNGITTTIAPYAIMVVLAAGAGVYFVYSRRRRNH